MSIWKKTVSGLAGIALAPVRTKNDIVHFAFHKNLTRYYGKVASQFSQLTGRKYAHFNSELGDFMREQPQLDMASANNHYIDIATFPNEVIASRFVRDPRDLIVSGYFYHESAARCGPSELQTWAANR